MSKTTLALQLLARLSNGALYKKGELAEFLEVKPRKLVELRNELIDAGYYIETFSGPYGGYRLDKSRSRMISIFNITASELNSLKFVQKTAIQDGVHFQNFTHVIEKVDGYLNRHDALDFNIIQPVYEYRLKDIENKHFELLHKAIKHHYRVECKYQSLDASIKTIYLKPYELYYYKGFWYVITYNQKQKKAYHFKLVRMKDVTITYKKFERHPDFQLKNFTGETSIFKNEEFALELTITPPNSVILSEMIIAKNQEIIQHSDGTITFKGIMEGKVEIISWLLSLGTNVTVNKPLEIKEAYLQALQAMYQKHIANHS